MAAFVTFHLTMVVLELLPNFPRVDDGALKIPDVAVEVDRITAQVAGWSGRQGDEEAVRDELLAVARSYKGFVDGIDGWTNAYLVPLGSEQTWNMFGGNARRFPRRMVVQVRPNHERELITVAEEGWGVDPSVALVHRHRKVSRHLSTRGFKYVRQAYAKWHARQWNEAHPDRSAAEVRVFFLESHTPTAAEARSGAPLHTEAESKKVLLHRWFQR